MDRPMTVGAQKMDVMRGFVSGATVGSMVKLERPSGGAELTALVQEQAQDRLQSAPVRALEVRRPYPVPSVLPGAPSEVRVDSRPCRFDERRSPGLEELHALDDLEALGGGNRLERGQLPQLGEHSTAIALDSMPASGVAP